MLKNILKFYIREGIGFSFSEKPLSYLKNKPEIDRKETTEIKKNNNPINNLKSLQKEKNFATSSNVKEAQKICKKLNTIEELSSAIKNFDGCDLKILASQAVIGDGISKNPLVMVIGEHPARDDDKTGIPFSGAEGDLLDKMLKSISLDRKENCYLSNILNWWPPGNRPPTEEEIAVSLPFIKKHIEIASPRMIILLGGKTSQNILGIKDGINKTRGKTFSYIINSAGGTKKEINCVPIFTPNFILNNKSMKSVVWKDLLFIKDLIEKL